MIVNAQSTHLFSIYSHWHCSHKKCISGMNSQRITMKENISAAQKDRIDNEMVERGIKHALNRMYYRGGIIQ